MIKVNISKKMHTQDGEAQLSLDINIKQNICTAICGESGAGKTTFLRMIAGLTKPDSGIIQTPNQIFFSSDQNINIEVQKRNIGFVFQDYALFPNMTVEGNILFALEKKEDKIIQAEYIKELLATVELDKLLKKYPREISGGQKQRVALARALVKKPKLLLLDEPLSALDSNMRNKLQNYLAVLTKQYSLTTVLVSHDLEEIKNLSQEIITLKNGRVM